MSAPSTVVFDLGDVLIRWNPHAAIAAGVGEEEARRFLCATDFDFYAWNRLQDAGRSWREGEAAAVASHPHWHRHVLAYRANFRRAIEHDLPDTVAILADLNRAGVPLFALTNWSSELFVHARERHAFLAWFDDIVVSGEEGTLKPSDEIFQILHQRIGRPLTECVFVDDSPANVEAAARSGVDAIEFTDAGELRRALAERGLPV